MDETIIRRAEALIDLGAAAALGAAVAWLGLQLGLVPMAGGGAGLFALAAAFAVLRRVRPEVRIFELAKFDPGDLESAELLLTAAVSAPEADELTLDDVLAPPEPDARVVRLFDVSAMPTPGELKARSDRHLAVPQTAPPDASQALFSALAELRSSLR